MSDESTTTPQRSSSAETVEELGSQLGAELGGALGADTAAAEPEEFTKTAEPEPADAAGFWRGTGRRKTAVARVRIKPNESGEVKVQVGRKKFKSIEEYFVSLQDQNDVYSPLKLTQTLGKLDVIARLDGGGVMGQAQAFRLGIARALKGYDPSLEGVLREHGYLTRDPREVERKKPGQPGARRRFQFSKR